jgi:hypothetical protein
LRVLVAHNEAFDVLLFLFLKHLLLLVPEFFTIFILKDLPSLKLKLDLLHALLDEHLLLEQQGVLLDLERLTVVVTWRNESFRHFNWLLNVVLLSQLGHRSVFGPLVL